MMSSTITTSYKFAKNVDGTTPQVDDAQEEMIMSTIPIKLLTDQTRSTHSDIWLNKCLQRQMSGHLKQ